MPEALIPTMATIYVTATTLVKNHLFFKLGNSSVLAPVDNLHQGKIYIELMLSHLFHKTTLLQ